MFTSVVGASGVFPVLLDTCALFGPLLRDVLLEAAWNGMYRSHDFWATTSNKQLNTLLRLPTGIFYAQGVKANVLFFDRRAGSAQASTKRLWVYDLRTNKHFTLKTNPLQRSDLDEFVGLYKPGAIDQRQPTWNEESPDGRWRCYALEELLARDKISLDLFWLKDESLLDSDNLPEPDVIAAEIAEDLRSVLEQMEEILGDLELSPQG